MSKFISRFHLEKWPIVTWKIPKKTRNDFAGQKPRARGRYGVRVGKGDVMTNLWRAESKRAGAGRFSRVSVPSRCLEDHREQWVESRRWGVKASHTATEANACNRWTRPADDNKVELQFVRRKWKELVRYKNGSVIYYALEKGRYY